MSRHIVIEGNLTRDPNGGYGKDTGKAYTHLDIAVTDRIRNNQGEWVDGPTTYYRVTAFGKTAENALNSLTKGNTVIATGELTVRNYTRTDGTPGIANEIIADHLGAALTYTSVTINPKTANRDQLTELPVEAARHRLQRGCALRSDAHADQASLAGVTSQQVIRRVIQGAIQIAN